MDRSSAPDGVPPHREYDRPDASSAPVITDPHEVQTFGSELRHCSEGCSFLSLAHTAFDIVVTFTLSGLAFHEVNTRGRNLLGIGTDEPVDALSWPDLLHGTTMPTMLFDIVPAIEARGAWRGDLLLRRRDGGEVPVLAFVTATPACNGETVAILGAFDRSENARLLAALQAERQLLASLLNTVPDAVYFKDRSSRFIRVSAAKARKSHAARPEDLIGKSDFDHFTGEHAAAAFRDEQKIIETGEPIIDFEEKETWPDGSVTWVSSTKLPLRDVHGRIIGTYGISRDITARKKADEERRAMEMQLNIAQKMESIGRLAAGIAHEVNTPTQFISDNTHFLTDSMGQFAAAITAFRDFVAKLPAGAVDPAALAALKQAEASAELDYLLEEIPRALQQTHEGIARIAKIVRSLKEFSHPSSPDLHPADLNRAIETTITVARHEWKYVADVRTDFDENLPMVPCVLDEFNQAMLNLIVNAAHAITDVVGNSGQKGQITIRTRLDGDAARIEVEDSGTGIPEAVRSRIFEPFFTTKEAGKGTGQGLAMVRSIIERKHRGQIGFTTELGKGTVFHMRLPLENRPATAPS